jgi:hypothetical protein
MRRANARLTRTLTPAPLPNAEYRWERGVQRVLFSFSCFKGDTSRGDFWKSLSQAYSPFGRGI